MPVATQRILIEGVGSVGGVIAGELLERGVDVTLVTGNPAIAAAINRDGLALSTPTRSFTVPARAWASLAELPPSRFDAAYLLMMAGGAIEAAEQSMPLLQDDGYLVAFQNGFVEVAISERCGAGRVLSACVAFGATMEAPGVYRRTTAGRVFIGELDGRVTPRIEGLRDTLAEVIEVRISTNITGVLWGKLAWNCAVSALCAVSGLALGEVIASELGQCLLLVSYREALDTARAHGVVLERAVVDHERFYLPRGADARLRADKQTLVAQLAAAYAEVKPSTLQSLLRGRKTEIEFLNGYLVGRAREVGLEARLNAALVDMVGEIERGRRQIARANLDELRGLVATLL